MKYSDRSWKKIAHINNVRMINLFDSSLLFFEQTKSIFYRRFKTHEVHVEQWSSSGGEKCASSNVENAEYENHFSPEDKQVKNVEFQTCKNLDYFSCFEILEWILENGSKFAATKSHYLVYLSE